MENLNLIGFDLKTTKQSVYSLIDFVHDARQSLDHLDEKINKMLELSYRSRFRLEEFYGEVPRLQNNLAEGKETLTKGAFLAQNTLDFLDTAPEKLKNQKKELQKIADDLDSEISRVLHKAEQTHENVNADLQALQPKFSHLESELDSQIQHLTKLRELVASFLPDTSLVHSLDKMIAQLNGVGAKSRSVRGVVSSVNHEVEHALESGRATQKAIENLRSDFRTSLDEIREEYEREIEPLLNDVLVDVNELSLQGVDRIDRLEKRMPDVQKNIGEGIDVINSEIEKVRSFQDKLPEFQGSVSSVDRQLQKRKNNGKLDDLIEVATLDPGRFSDFIAEPVNLVENRIFPIPNYGSAMSPFFTTLAIWVGSLLCISVFTTRSKEKKFYHCKSYQKYLGKRLFFVTIALLQGAIVALGDMFFLKAYVAHPWVFFLTSLWTAMVFSMIIYTTVATFGSGGKAIVIVFLVLQLSGAGGTFPVELS